jgi:hypothetical protein
MRNKRQFAEDLRHYICNILLNDNLIDLAFDAQIDRDDVLDRLQPLLTRTMPFHAQTRLHAALPDSRRTLNLLASTLDALGRLPQWRASDLREAVTRAAAGHQISALDAHSVCTCWMLFGSSPLDVYSSMEALGREAVCQRCEAALNSLRANLMVS